MLSIVKSFLSLIICVVSKVFADEEGKQVISHRI